MKKINIIIVIALFAAVGFLGFSPKAHATAGCGFDSAGDYTCRGSGDLRSLPDPGAATVPPYTGPQNNGVGLPPAPPYTPGDLSFGVVVPYVPLAPVFTIPIYTPLPGVIIPPVVLCDTGTPTTGEPGMPAATGGCDDYLNELGNNRECVTTDPAGRWDCVNSYGYLGRYQMGAEALIDAGYAAPGSTNSSIIWTGRDGVNSQADFLANHTAQNNAVNEYNRRQWNYIESMGLDSYVGQTINGRVVTQGSMIAAAHGHGVGNLRDYLESNGTDIHSDGYGMNIETTMDQFRGFDMSGCLA